MAFCRDISSHEENPDPGDKKFPGYSEDKKSRGFSWGFFENPSDKIPKLRKISNLRGYKIPRLKKSRIRGIKNPETQKISSPRD